jgi:hypothetical protein
MKVLVTIREMDSTIRGNGQKTLQSAGKWKPPRLFSDGFSH